MEFRGNIKIPESAKELPEELLQEGRKHLLQMLERVAGITYAPHNSKEDDEEMERFVYEEAGRIFAARKAKNKGERFIEDLKTISTKEEKGEE